MLMTTTSTLQDRKIADYLGVVTGETILGANVFRDIMASITDIIGGRSGAYEESLNKAKNIAMEEMQNNARSLGADGIIGIDLDFETVGNGMLMVAVTGTAVRLG